MALLNKMKSSFKRLTNFFQIEKIPTTIFNRTLIFAVLFLSALHVYNFYQSVPTTLLAIHLIAHIILGLIVSILIVWILKLLPFIPSILKITILFVYLWLFYSLHTPSIYGWTLMSALIILPTLIMIGLYQWKNGRIYLWNSGKKIFWMLVILFSSATFMMAAFVFFSSGTKEKLSLNYKGQENFIKPLNLANPTDQGPYKPLSFSYGSGIDKRRVEFGSGVKIRTASVNASRLLPSWTGISGKLRSWYFGFTPDALPMNALVWYPENKEGPLPLVIIVHGNHLAQDPSDPGYAYLAKLLASRGYLVVSIDQNFLNTSLTDLEAFGQYLKNENAARAWLLLKHLELLRTWNKSHSIFFYDRIDMDRIAIVGHSRGGEAVGHAAVFNKLSHYPEDANERFDFNFNIRSVIAIAPVDGQYKPSGTLVKIKDVNYFVFHGALDMDMQSYGGLATLKRIEFSERFKGFKAGLYISNANHGQFNSSWGRKDGISPGINRFNLDQLMDESQQRKISSVYISAFLESTINSNEAYKPLFMDARYGREWLPNMIYMSQFEPAEKTVIANFEEDLDVQSTTIPHGHISNAGLLHWKEQENKLMWGHGLSKAVYLEWEHVKTKQPKAWYSIDLSAATQNYNPFKTLSFSLAQNKENTKGEERTIDFTIELKDSKGNQISFPLSHCKELQPQIAKHISKFRFFDDLPNSEAIPNYFYFNLASLARSNPKFRIEEIKQIKFIFDKTKSGAIILDDIFLTD